MNSQERRLLEETPERCLTFLRTMSTKVEIRAAMMQAGYSEAEQALGWKLLLAASGYGPETLPMQDDRAARAAIAELDAWDEPMFRRIRAALGRLHAEQADFVFAELEAARGVGALVAIATLLDRLDALESPDARPDTREADAAALATLAARGIDARERARVRELLTLAQSAIDPTTRHEPPMSSTRADALRELRAWFLDWSETARAVIRRRDYLIMLGLLKRRRRDRADDVAASDLDDASDATDMTDMEDPDATAPFDEDDRAPAEPAGVNGTPTPSAATL